jgi:hypothetical protein
MVDHGLDVAAHILDDIGPGTGDLVLMVAQAMRIALRAARVTSATVITSSICG